MRLLLGTTNLAKIASFKKYLIRDGLELITLNDIGLIDEPLEVGETFEEIALLKAKYYANKTEYPTLADDGGFEADALDGGPGVESKRWAGPNATDQDRIDKLIKYMEGIPEKQRTARLRAVMVVYFPDAEDYVKVDSSIEGVVPRKASPAVMPHFPYRSVLFLPEYGKCLSELSDEEIGKVDHRPESCRRLLLKLEPWINSS